MAVKLLRLKSGEDIVTDVKKENAEYTTTVNVTSDAGADGWSRATDANGFGSMVTF